MMPGFIIERNDEDAEGVVLQLEPDDADYTIEFWRTLEPSEQDRRLGQDKVCVVYYDGVAYGAIKDWRLDGQDFVCLTLTPAAAKELELPVENRFGCDDVDDIRPYYEKVREMLLATGELKG